MALRTENDRMFPIAQLISQDRMRRSIAGALATDRVVPERPPPARRTTRAPRARDTRPHAPAGDST
ncbi:MAG: hypothetical protein QOJ35_1755 [Solirubrobacteraceae bacterium]|nr:hypothetical protein [Solirubrobacteraceae bacterium]